MSTITSGAVFYHLYPLGAFGAPRENDGSAPAEDRLIRLREWIPAMRKLGCTALYLGPVFESERHGYDTVDYSTVDRRLGTNRTLRRLSEELKDSGIALVLDAVFNHVGRRHPFVQDVAERGMASPYARWIAGYDPSRPGPGGLPFAYEGWKGHFDLVKLDTANPEVREYLVGVAESWIDEYGIAGLRLDAADCLDRGFMRLLGERCRSRRPGFFLLGEAVHGDHYAPLLSECGLDSVTNFESWKGLWSSYNDRNYFEIAWTLDRLFGPNGLCRGRHPYSFADNHDVDRVASLIRDPAGLYPLYALLFSMPGIPSVYYGSEYALRGARTPGDDAPVRPELDPVALAGSGSADLARAVARFSAARRASAALCRGEYRQLAVQGELIAFLRATGDQHVVVAVNGAADWRTVEVRVPEAAGRALRDLLDEDFRRCANGDGILSFDVPPHWTRWLAVQA